MEKKKEKKDQLHFITCFLQLGSDLSGLYKKDTSLSSDLDFHWGFSIAGGGY